MLNSIKSENLTFHKVNAAWKLGLLLWILLVGIWPALYNGQPIFFPDTTAYIRGADAAISKITGHQSIWSPPPVSAAGDVVSLSNPKDKFVIAGRSIYYGALLYAGDLFGGFWPTVVLQAAAVALAVGLTLHLTIGFSWFALTAVVTGLAIVTPLAFFASFLMPDIFAGVAILGAANLAVHGDRMTRAIMLAWISLVCAAALFHTSHLLLLATMLGLCALGKVLRKIEVSWKGLAGLAFCIAVAFAGEAAFTLAVKTSLGAEPVRPPYLMARMIADGPGADYLKENCPHAGFTVCRFVDKLPISSAENFLWSTDPTQSGVFASSDPDTRRALVAEQNSFILATLKYDPLGVIKCVLRNSILQIVDIGLIEFNYHKINLEFYKEHVPKYYLAIMKGTEAWNDEMPVASVSKLVLASTIVSTLFIVGVLIQNRRATEQDRRFETFAGIIVAGVLLNAFICGALSGPNERYQARVIWLAPLLACLLYLWRRARTVRC